MRQTALYLGVCMFQLQSQLLSASTPYSNSSGTHRSLLQVLQPAIELGEKGFPVSPITAYYWGRGAGQLKDQGGSGIKALLQPDGTAPKAGQLQKNAHLAATFRSLAEHGAEEGEP